MIDIALNANFAKKQNCCGCTACAAICPKSCIEMQEDSEGFLYPVVNKESCVNCKACERVCPISVPLKQTEYSHTVYYLQCRDDNVRAESTSGGMFTALANYVIEEGGVVFGAAFRSKDDYYVMHKMSTDSEGVKEFRGSKYVQSDINSTYSMAKEELKKNKTVCFSGTPCQIAGLKKYLGHDYKNLITVDVVCRAVPSPFVWAKYVEVFKNKYGDKIDRFKFRDKIYGYSYSTMSVYMKEKTGIRNYHRGIESDLWLRMFFSGLITRESCEVCPYRNSHVSDFTIWDCFTIKKYVPEFDDDKGTTRMRINTPKGNEVFGKIDKAYRYKCLAEDSVGGDRERAYEEKVDLKYRENFFQELHIETPEVVFEKYMPYTLKIAVLQYGRMITYKLGIYKSLKKIWNYVKNKR